MNNMLQIPARQTILRVLEVRESGSILLQGRCGCTILNNIINLAPCHLPNINGTLHPKLARPPKDYARHPQGGLRLQPLREGWHYTRAGRSQ
jgi:hypothetical protein